MSKASKTTHRPDVPHETGPEPHWCVGIDWGDQRHHVVVLDQNRRRVGERVVPHDGASLAQLVVW